MNNFKLNPADSKPDMLASRLKELRTLLKDMQPEQLATASGTTYHPLDKISGEFHIDLWGRDIVLTFPDFIAHDNQTGDKLTSSSLALLLYYISTCDGTTSCGQWISFSELPDGRFYNQAYQGYTGGKLAQVFKNNLEVFCLAAENLGGKRVYLFGDAAYEFQVLPYVNLLAVTWQGDEDFNATYQILFDAAVSHHLPTDACAIIGSNLTRRLTAERESLDENRY